MPQLNASGSDYNAHIGDNAKKIDSSAQFIDVFDKSAAPESTSLLSRAVFDASPYVTILLDDHFRIIDCNSAAVKLYGFESKIELMQKLMPILEACDPRNILSDGEEGVSVGMWLMRAVEQGVVSFEITMPLCNGLTPTKVTLQRIDHGDTFMIVAYQLDLKPLKTVEMTLLNQDKLLRTVNSVAVKLLQGSMESFKETIQWTLRVMGQSVNADRMYIWRNIEKDGELCCQQIYEWVDKATSFELDDFASEGLTYAAVPNWRESLENGRCINSFVRNLSPEEREILEPQGALAILVIPIFYHDSFWGFIGFDDCRQERLFSGTEEKILQSSGILMVSAILRNEATQDLMCAVESAQDSTKAKSRFLANMSHEIRTPMNAIIGMTAIAQETNDNGKIRDCLERINSASRLLLGIINDVLDMSKIEARKVELAEEEFSFRQMVDNICSMNSGRAEEKEQQLIVIIDDDIPSYVISDEMRLSQVITNLLSNAIKFTPQNGVIKLTVKLISSDISSCEIFLSVQDTGIGIAPEMLKILFNPFEQGAAGISRNFGGTGLGLAISKSIIQQMGGVMHVESTPDKGSIFSFRLRLPRGSEHGVASSAKNEKIKTYDFSGKTALLVEDLEINRIIVMALLDSTNVQFVCAENGLIACEMFAESPDKYDMIFMDIHMPVLDGLQATERIRASNLPHAQSIPIVAMTANAFAEDIALCLKAGMNDHIAKPIDVAGLLEKTNRYLNQRESSVPKT